MTAAELAGLSTRATYRAIERGELRVARLCLRLRIPRAAFEEWIERGRVRPAERPAPPAPPTPPPIPGSFRALLAQRRRRAWRPVDDYLVLRLRPSGERIRMFRAFAALVPAALWTIYFIVLAIAYNVGWPVDLAVGVGRLEHDDADPGLPDGPDAGPPHCGRAGAGRFG